MGMDYVVEDIPLEANFNIQLGESYNGLAMIRKKNSIFESQSIIKIIKINESIFKNNSNGLYRGLSSVSLIRQSKSKSSATTTVTEPVI
jgi:hypothetical protein